MALTTNLARDIQGEIRRRGADYYARGAVRLIDGDEWLGEATVQGRSRYPGGLTRANKRTVTGWCSCPYFQENLEPCKHIWATLLAAQAQDYLRGIGQGDPQALEADMEGVKDWEQGHDLEDDYADDWNDGGYDPDEDIGPYRAFPSAPKRARSSGKKPKLAPRTPTWKQSLTRLRAAMRKEESPHHDFWPPGREMLYVVDVAETMEGNGLALEVAYRERKKNGEWGKPKSQRIPKSAIARLPDPMDRQVLALLVGADERTGYGYGYSYGYYYDSAPCRYLLSE